MKVKVHNNELLLKNKCILGLPSAFEAIILQYLQAAKFLTSEDVITGGFIGILPGSENTYVLYEKAEKLYVVSTTTSKHVNEVDISVDGNAYIYDPGCPCDIKRYSVDMDLIAAVLKSAYDEALEIGFSTCPSFFVGGVPRPDVVSERLSKAGVIFYEVFPAKFIK